MSTNEGVTFLQEDDLIWKSKYFVLPILEAHNF
jgi:hypothetical protein